MKVLEGRMRRYLFVCMLLCILISSPLTAQEDLGWWGSYYIPGNMSAGVLLSAGSNPFSINAFPNAELKFYKWRPANLFALDFGIGARGGFNLVTGDFGYAAVSAGPYVSMHLGFRGFEELGLPGFEYLERLDFFTTYGLNFQLVFGENVDLSPFVFTTVTGLNFFLTDNLAATAATVYQSGIGGIGAGLGIMVKLGPKERLGEAPQLGLPVYSYFNIYYAMAFAFSGGFWDDESFEVGDHIRWRFRAYDSVEDEEFEFSIERTLLHRSADRQHSWWRMVFDHPAVTAESDWPSVFEFQINEDYDIVKIRYMDPSSQKLTTYVPEDPALWRKDFAYEQQDRESLQDYFVRREEVSVSAGSFQTELYYYEDVDYETYFWISDEVPGYGVKSTTTTVDDILAEGELMFIRKGVSSPWAPAW